ncbi:MAG: FN3 associated domain-containing protein [Fibrobacteria bacterium]
MNRKSASKMGAGIATAICIAMASAAWLALLGCVGGTSTGADNPELVLQVRQDGKPIAFTGYVQFFAENSNPEFFALPPEDGAGTDITIQYDDCATFKRKGENSISISARCVERLMNEHPYLPLPKSSAAAARGAQVPDFNIVLTGMDSTTGLLTGIHVDTASGYFRDREGNPDTLTVSISRGQTYAGAVDTATDAGPALGLFVPGTAFFAAVHGDSFTFADIPEGRFPLRWVSTDGRVYAMPDSLGMEWTQPLQPGERIDSIRIPPSVPTLALPEADPRGRYAFSDSVAVTLTAEPGAIIYYTLDGSEPIPSSTRYAHPIVLRGNATLKAVAYLKGFNHSSVAINNYDLVPLPPVAVPAGKTFRDSIVVSLTAKSKSAAIHYTLDGSAPSAAGLKYSRPLVLKATTTVKALVLLPGLGESKMVEETYVLETDSLAAP